MIWDEITVFGLNGTNFKHTELKLGVFISLLSKQEKCTTENILRE